jgi:CRP-like cAMP-binding protein
MAARTKRQHDWLEEMRDNSLQLLRQHPVFGRGTDETLSRLAGQSTVRHADSGAFVTRAGLPQSEVLVVASGRLRLFRTNKTENRTMLMGIISSPAIIGDAEFHGSTSWTMSTQAIELSTIVAIPNAVFDNAVSNDLEVAAALYRDASARHCLVIQMVQLLVLQSSGNRILSFLLEHADPAGEVRIESTRIASALGLDRKTVFRNLKDLEARGLVTRDKDRGKVTIPPDYSVMLTQGESGLGAAWRQT